MNIRNMRAVFFASFLLVSLVTYSSQAFAEINIAVVDVAKILAESKAAKSVQSQVNKKREKFLKEVKKTEDKLRKDQKAIEEKRSKLSQEDFLKEIQSFERTRIKARSNIQEKKKLLDDSYSEGMSVLTKAIYDVCQEIADEDNIDLVITRQNIIVGSKSLDITKKVMERMNKKLPKLTLKNK